MNVLVTGGAGFLGGYIMAALQRQGHEAFAYDIAPPGSRYAGSFTGHCHPFSSRADQRYRPAFRGLPRGKIEAIIHSAGMVGLEPSLEQPIATYQTNIMGLINVCEVARQLEMRRVVFVSSNAAYHKSSGAALVETDPAFSIRDGNPAGHYGTSKMAGEAIGLAYAELSKSRFPRLARHRHLRLRYAQPNVHQADGREFGAWPADTVCDRWKNEARLHPLADCSDGIVAALLAPPWKTGEQRVINVAGGSARTAAEVAKIVRDTISGADIEIGDDLTPLEEQNVKMRASLDITSAKRLLNWSPKWPLEVGIAEYAETFRHHLSRSSNE